MRVWLHRFTLTSVVLGAAFVCDSTYAQVNVAWLDRFGESSWTYADSVSATADSFYVAGQTWGAFPGQTNLGGYDVFVRKYDLNGNELWTRQFGSQYNDHANSVSAVADGVYVVGYTDGTLPGQTKSGDRDAFVVKYAPDGTQQWIRQFGSPVISEALGVSAAPDGVYVTGNTGGSPETGIATGFVRKYDFNGNELWTRNDGGAQISATADGLYVVGLLTTALNPPFLGMRRYDLYGNEQWTRQFGSPANCCQFVAAAADGVYVAGSADLNGLTGVVRKYDPSGNELWTRQFSSPAGGPRGVSAAVDGVTLVWGYASVSQYDPNGNAAGVSTVNVDGLTLTGVDAASGPVFVVGSINYNGTFVDAAVAMLVPGPVSRKPVSQVALLPALEASPNFIVQWSGTDAGGPGIQDYAIYVSDNGGPFTTWLTQTAATQATFTGVPWQTYGFYSIARDLAGNQEDPKNSAETSTRIADTTKPGSHVSALPATEASPNFLVQWSGTDADSGIQDYSIYASDNGAPFVLWLTQVTATQANFAGSVGHGYGFYSIARDIAGNQEDIKSGAEATTRVLQVPGDVNGDGKIDCADVAIVKASLGKRTGQQGFDPRADINGDGIVDVRDFAAVSQKLAPGTKCP